MKRLAAVSLSLVIVLAAANGEAKKKRRVVVDRIVAVVDESPITKSALDRETAPYRKRIMQKHALDPKARDAALREVERTKLREMIDNRLLAAAAARARVVVSQEEIEQGIADMAKQGGMSVPELWQWVAREGSDEADYRRRIAEQLVSWRFAGYEAVKRTPDFSKLSIEEQRAEIATTMRVVAGELRSVAHIEERL